MAAEVNEVGRGKRCGATCVGGASAVRQAVSRIVNSGDVKDKFAADGANPAPPISVDQFKNAYLREVSKWEQFTRNWKVKL